VLHDLSHKSNLNITVLTRETAVEIPFISTSTHAHKRSLSNQKDEIHPSATHFSHVETSFSDAELTEVFTGVDTIICLLSGADVHLSAPIIAAATAAGVGFFIPSEYGLDTSNLRIRELLPPYRTRFEIQQLLKNSGMRWKALYTGLVLEEAMKPDGILDLDLIWGSVAMFPNRANKKVAISSYKHIADEIVHTALTDGDLEQGNEIWKAGFQVTLEELVKVVEKELDRELDRYEANLGDSKKEAEERMKMGYFDGGVSLMGRVAAWDTNVDAWSNWRKQGKGQASWEEDVERVVRMVRKGEVAGAGCGC